MYLNKSFNEFMGSFVDQIVDYKLYSAHHCNMFLTVLAQLNIVTASVIFTLLSVLSVDWINYSLCCLLVQSPDVTCSVVTLEHFKVMYIHQ